MLFPTQFVTPIVRPPTTVLVEGMVEGTSGTGVAAKKDRNLVVQHAKFCFLLFLLLAQVLMLVVEAARCFNILLPEVVDATHAESYPCIALQA